MHILQVSLSPGLPPVPPANRSGPLSSPSNPHTGALCTPVSEAAQFGLLRPVRPSTILLLSSDAPLCSLLRPFLEHAGFAVIVCISLERARRLYRGSPDLDLWLIDTLSWGYDAVHLAMSIASVHPTVPILMLTPASLDPDSELTFQCMGWMHASRPVELSEILAMISWKLHRRSPRVATVPATTHTSAFAGPSDQPPIVPRSVRVPDRIPARISGSSLSPIPPRSVRTDWITASQYRPLKEATNEA